MPRLVEKHYPNLWRLGEEAAAKPRLVERHYPMRQSPVTTKPVRISTIPIKMPISRIKQLQLPIEVLGMPTSRTRIKRKRRQIGFALL